MTLKPSERKLRANFKGFSERWDMEVERAARAEGSVVSPRAVAYPESWSEVTLGELLEDGQYGLSVPMAAEGRYIILRMNAIQDGEVIVENPKYVDLPECIASRYLLNSGDILFNRTNSLELVGKVGVYRGSHAVVFASYLIRLLPDLSKADRGFLGKLLTSAPVQNRIRRYATPSVQQVNINATNLQRVRVVLPLGPDGLEEQRAVARILDAADAAISAARVTLTKAQELQRGLVQALLTRGIDSDGRIRNPNSGTFTHSRFGVFPASWQVQSLRDVAEVGSGVTLGRDLSGSRTVSLPYLRVANVQDGHIDTTEMKTVAVREEEVRQFQLQAGDVVMTEGGDIDKLGRGAIWDGSISPCLHQNHIFRVRADRTRLNPHYLAAVIAAEYGKRYFIRIAKRTTNLASINKTQLRAFPVPLPPLDEQERIIKILEAAVRRIQPLTERVSILQRLKRGLMQDLLTGRVRVPVP